MDYTQITPAQRKAMLTAVGASSMDDLLKQFPASVRLDRPLDLPAAMGELSLQQHLEELAAKDTPAGEKVCFLGAGCYDHFIPTAVDALASKGEFVTAYTPYQAEASQGALQAFFEFQTMVCQLSGMDIANASLYEGASALAEAVLMAAATSGKRQILVSRAISPDWRKVLTTYLSDLPAFPTEVPLKDGITDLAALKSLITDDTAAIVVASPNFLGLLEDVPAIADLVRAKAITVIQVYNPISVGIVKRPGDQGAEIAVAEGQPLGIPMSFGGPYLGLFSAKNQFMRRMPGRLVGQTVDADGKRAFCLTLQTREQHIRREKATSNVCTNQGLMALRAAIYMAAMGPRGLHDAAQLSHNNASYFAEKAQNAGLKLPFAKRAFFNELVVQPKRSIAEILKSADAAKILPGLSLATEYPDLPNSLLIAFTEKRTKPEIDALIALLAN